MKGFIQFIKLAILAHWKIMPINWWKFTAHDWAFCICVYETYACLFFAFLVYPTYSIYFLFGALAGMVGMVGTGKNL